jgi:hypothetical protein
MATSQTAIDVDAGLHTCGSNDNRQEMVVAKRSIRWPSPETVFFENIFSQQFPEWVFDDRQ